MPVLTYLFHRLEQRFDAKRPSLLVLDEAWLFLDHPAFSAKIREWLKVLRKANVAVWFATQSLADVAQSKIMPTLIEACMTKIFLPNSSARNDEVAKFYRMFGLNDKQLDILASSTPKRDYYLTSPQGNQLFSLGLGPLALAVCGATGKEAQRDAIAIRKTTNSPCSSTKRTCRTWSTSTTRRRRPSQKVSARNPPAMGARLRALR